MDTNQVDQTKPIPAFYACYLLRSSIRHASLYIGSTPDPARRLAQHNGVAKGGAKHTARANLRPWEVVLLVEGFMSRVGALQFEWAWQHTKDSRHLGPDADPSLISDVATTSGKAPRKRTGGRSLKAHLENLHDLLRSNYFSSWPLRIRFFSADVYRVWKAWSDRVDGFLPSHIRIILDGDCPQRNKDDAVGSVQTIETTYNKIGHYLEKAAFLLDDPNDLQCKVCQGQVIPKDELVVVCPQTACHCISHMSCLSASFLNAAGEPDRFVPMHGTCPACEKNIQWPVIMQELSLRHRGDKELPTVLRRRKQKDHQIRKIEANAKNASSSDASSTMQSATIHPHLDGMDSSDDLTNDDPLDERWAEGLASESDSDTDTRCKARPKAPPSRLEIVIEDSEDD